MIEIFAYASMVISPSRGLSSNGRYRSITTQTPSQRRGALALRLLAFVPPDRRKLVISRRRVVLAGVTAILAAVALTGCTSATAPAVEASQPAKQAPASTPTTPTTPPTPKAESLAGIYFLTGESSTSQIQIGELDPSTGVVQVARNFTAVGGSAFAVDNFTSFFMRMSFDPQFHRVAATISNPSDGSEDVGWITDTGRFVDVTKAVTAAGSTFSGPTKNGGPAFGPDGAFYFVDLNSRKGFRVTSTNPTGPSDAVQIDGTADSGNVQTWVFPNGVVEFGWAGSIPLVQNLDKGLFGMGAVDDWLNATTMLTTASDQSNIHLSDGVAFDPRGSGMCFGSGSCKNERELLPAIADRQSYNPIASPDGTQVAFLSSLTHATAGPQLFIVPSDGGTPKLVTTNQVFVRPSNGLLSSSAPVQLIGWR